MGSYSESLQKTICAIEKQQPKVKNAIWCVGEQLKDLLRREPQWAEMVLQDLSNKNQSLSAIEKKIAECAKKNEANGVGFVSPTEAEKIIRSTYGIPMQMAEETALAPSATPAGKGRAVDLGAFL